MRYLLLTVLLSSGCSRVPEDVTTIRIGSKSLKVRLLKTYERRRDGLLTYGKLLDVDGLLFCYPRDRYHHYWYDVPAFRHDFDVAFLDAHAAVVEAATLVRSPEGITSAKECRYALVAKEGTLKDARSVEWDAAAVTTGVEDNPVLEIGSKRIFVELAVDGSERERGLMFRKRMSADDGMLFVYPHSGPMHFWMGNTLIPLTLAFVDEGLTMFKVVDMETYDDPRDLSNTKRWSSERAARYALEVNQGRLDIAVGAKVKLPAELSRYKVE